ncbi:thiamine pyrophosphate-binding protein, partial [Nocardia farcinica]|uniref:thiamine pyrophosphate-binding protein n=1 Tax=Nocardia farcinica TaxID=37329 RepID=UPI003CC80531
MSRDTPTAERPAGTCRCVRPESAVRPRRSGLPAGRCRRPAAAARPRGSAVSAAHQKEIPVTPAAPPSARPETPCPPPVSPPRTERLTGAQAVVRSLEEIGVEVVFGIPGGAILPVYDPLLDSRRIRHVLVRHEQGAGHAATGYAQATGRV